MKNQIQLTFYFLLIAFTAISCSPQIDITQNTYQSFVESGILMEGNTIRFYGENQFEFKHWSDNLSSNKKGMGKYQIEGNSLILNFEEPEKEANTVTAKTNDSADSNAFNMHIQDSNKKPLIGVICAVLDSESNPLAQCATDKNGACQLTIDQLSKAKAKEIKVTYLGMNEESIEVKGGKAMTYGVTLTGKTKYYPAGTRLIYKAKTQKDVLVLEDGNKVQRLQIVE